MLVAGMVLALCAGGVAIVISYVHGQLADSQAGYTSFCNVNATVNCDRVLSSRFAALFGIPIAWFAVGVYAAIAMLFGSSAVGPRGQRRGALRLACLAVYASAVFSAYMAYLSFFVLNTVCLLCSGLYVLTLALLWVAWRAPGRFDTANAVAQPTLPVRARLATLVGCSLAVALIAWVAWPGQEASGAQLLTAAQIREQEPAFYEWYTERPRITPPLVDRHSIGNPEAPVTIVEFFDFECGHCAANHVRLKDLLARRGDEVRLIYRHFPLDTTCNDAVPVQVHARACRAAEAAECAALQGRFEAMVDAMFLRQHQLFEDNLPRIAGRLGLDVDAFRTCLAEHRTLPLVLADTRAGARLEITSTPTMFINGRRVEGMIEQAGGYDYALTLERELVSTDRTASR